MSNTLYVLTINYGPNGATESYFYKSLEVARRQMGAFEHEDGYLLTDDFGAEGRIVGDVHSVRLFDMEKSVDVHVEHSLHQARGQAKLQRRTAADPELKFGGSNVAPFRPGA